MAPNEDPNLNIKTTMIDEMNGRIDILEKELKAIKQWAMLAVAFGALNLGCRWINHLTE